MNYTTAKEMIDAGQVVVRDDIPERYIFLQKDEEQQLVQYSSFTKKITAYEPTDDDLKAVNWILKRP